MERQKEPVSAWTIAGGILLALLLLRACDAMLVGAAQQQAMEQLNASLSAAKAQGIAIRAAANARERERKDAEDQRRRAIEEAKALKPDERCIDHRRFRRLPNGWEQNGTC